MSILEYALLFLLQVGVILAVCRFIGALARRLGQPRVVGEMIAGVLLGPSLLGAAMPALHAALFPGDSLRVLDAAAEVGVGLFMFLVGVEFRTEQFRARLRSAAAVSLAGALGPIAGAALLIPWLMTVPGLFAPTTTAAEATLFLGAAMAITAFPMLARMLGDRGLAATPLGTLALAAGAINDAVAWCLLAAALGPFGQATGGASEFVATLWPMALGAVLAVVMPTLGRQLLSAMARSTLRSGQSGVGAMFAVLVPAALCALVLREAGIHVVFGGFLLGLAMPREVVSAALSRRLHPLADALLLPIFFACSGLDTRIDLVGGGECATVLVAVLGTAVLSKVVTCWAAARWTGLDAVTARGLGVLMNARGLMELVVANLALQRGLIGAALFAILVVMAIATTLLTAPLFGLVHGGALSSAAASKPVAGGGGETVPPVPSRRDRSRSA